MISLGVLLKGNVARLSALSGTQGKHEVIAPKVNKIEVPQHPTKDDVEVFVQAFKSFCMVNSVDLVVINRRPTTGLGAGGAATFLTEGILLATSPCPVTFIYPQTLQATDRRKQALKVHRPTAVDLGKAYDLAFEGLAD